MIIEKQISSLLEKKHLHSNLFEINDNEITIDSPIEVHSAWAYKHIYKVPYPNESKESGRFIHGIQHVNRACMYVPVIANLYSKHGDKEALNLTPEILKLVQIAVLFHDSAREGEDYDYWDLDSGLFIFYYLSKVLQIDRDTAQKIAEAMANKDFGNYENYVEYHLIQNGSEMVWESEKLSGPKEKNIYQKLIHDADCLDIIRARPHFDSNYLDFYKDLANKDELAFEEMAKLTNEVRSIIAIQGDSYNRSKKEVKDFYECESGYLRSLATIDKQRHSLISSLHKRLLSKIELSELSEQLLLDKTSSPYAPDKGVSPENLKAALYEGKLLARSIGAPSATEAAPKNRQETLVQVELRKLLRNSAIPTPKSVRKDGNPFRSMSLIGNSPSYASSGFLSLVEPELIQNVYLSDKDTGRGKKRYFNLVELAQDEKIPKLAHLYRMQQMGGASPNYKNFPHNEVLYHLRKKYDAIFYTTDPVMFNDEEKAPSSLAPYIEAIYLQKAYATAAHEFNERCKNLDKAEYCIEEKLPIYEYSGVHNFIRETPEIKSEELRQMWEKLITDYMEKECSSAIDLMKLNTMSVDDIKTNCFYGEYDEQQRRLDDLTWITLHSPDNNYAPELQEQINNIILRKKELLLRERIQSTRERINENSSALLELSIFFNLLNEPELMLEFKEKIGQLIKERLANPREFFDNEDVAGFKFNNVTLYERELLANKEKINSTLYMRESYYSNYSSIRLYELAKILDLPEKTLISDAARDYADQAKSSSKNRIFRIVFDILEPKELKRTASKETVAVKENNDLAKCPANSKVSSHFHFFSPTPSIGKNEKQAEEQCAYIIR